jgi:hypothetical protein
MFRGEWVGNGDAGDDARVTFSNLSGFQRTLGAPRLVLSAATFRSPNHRSAPRTSSALCPCR